MNNKRLIKAVNTKIFKKINKLFYFVNVLNALYFSLPVDACVILTFSLVHRHDATKNYLQDNVIRNVFCFIQFLRAIFLKKRL